VNTLYDIRFGLSVWFVMVSTVPFHRGTVGSEAKPGEYVTVLRPPTAPSRNSQPLGKRVFRIGKAWELFNCYDYTVAAMHSARDCLVKILDS
jgi:hypothetical protein